MKETLTHTPEEIEKRLKGIVASASFEDQESSPEDIENLRRLAMGEITDKEYEEIYGLNKI